MLNQPNCTRNNVVSNANMLVYDIYLSLFRLPSRIWIRNLHRFTFTLIFLIYRLIFDVELNEFFQEII